MSELPYVIQITLPLKDWKERSRSLEANQNYCSSKIFGFKFALKKMNEFQSFNSPINEVLRLYKLCSDILVLAETYHALLISLYATKKGSSTVFEFKFLKESSYNKFYQELIGVFESYNLENKTKTETES